MGKIDFKKRTIRAKASTRGGGIEIRLEGIKGFHKNDRMTAYQNYLGGGMLGSIDNSFSFALNEGNSNRAYEIGSQLKEYFHKEIMGMDCLNELDGLPQSAY